MSKGIEIVTEKLSEIQLEALLMSDIKVIDEGMVVLGNQIDTRSVGELDVLAVDDDGELRVIELKIKETDSQLLQGLRYLDWINNNISLISKVYTNEKKVKIDDSLFPRLILIAPSFSTNLTTAVKYIDSIYIDLYEYDVIQSGKNQRLILRNVDIDEIEQSTNIPTLKGHKDYLDDDNAQSVFDDMIAYFSEIGASIEPRKKRITFKMKGQIIGRYRGRRGWFKIESTIPEEGSQTYDIKDKSDWEYAKDHLFKIFL